MSGLSSYTNASVLDHDSAAPSWKRLVAREVCPECSEFTLSEIVVCKGTNIPTNKGRWYQRVSLSSASTLFELTHRPFCIKCLNRKRNIGHITPNAGAMYRSCDFFRWRDDLGRMESVWVDEVCAKSSSNRTYTQNERFGVTCSGEGCRLRPKARSGNKSCSNSQLCKDCCERAQMNGARECSYSSHNGKQSSLPGDSVS